MAFVLMLAALSGAKSQSDNSLYWLRSIPQASENNPALMPNAKFFFGLPALSSIYFGVLNSGFAFGDFYRKDNNGDYYWDEDHMLSKLSDRNYFASNVGIDVFGMGFNVGKGFLSLGISENINSLFVYPKDLIFLLTKGIDHFVSNDTPSDFEGSEIDILHFREYGLGYSFPIGQKLTFGIKLKAVQGLGKINFLARQMLVSQISQTNFVLDADLELNVAFPFKLGPFETLGDDFMDDFDPKEYFMGFRNLGGAIDLGFFFKPISMISIGLSATNLGFINWSSGVESYRMTGQTDFEGLDGNGGDEDNVAISGSEFERIRDALSDAFDVVSTDKTLKQNLPAMFYASVGLHLGKIQTLGLVSRSVLIDGKIRPDFTFSYNFIPFNAFGFAASYSIVDDAPNYFGAAFNINIGPLQVYAVADNISGYFDLRATKSLHARMGMNMVFGNRHKKKVEAPIVD